MNRELLLIGSIPFETAEEVFVACSKELGEHLPCMPDGETGERIWWINTLAYHVFHGHPDIVTIKRPPRENGVEKWKPADADELWEFKVRDGVDSVRFGDPGWRLGYAKDAIASYFVFKTLRKEGVIPKDVRFQVSLPLTNSAIDEFFRDPLDYPRIKPGFEDAMRAEIAKMVEKIPPHDLAIQWDCAIELMDLEDYWSWTPKAGKLERNLAPIPNLSPSIPEEVMLGYHLCYGTLGGWPMVSAKTLRNAVIYANEAVVRSGRRVDFIHIPVLNTAEESYFAPLEDLEVGRTALYFGVIHNMHDLEAFRKRVSEISKYVPEFGIAAPCGFGREQPDAVPGILRDHRRALDLLRSL